LYRVGQRLGEAGINVTVENGVSDEGDPWAVFEQVDTGDVIVHIARFDEMLTVVNSASGQSYRGSDFRAITDQMLRDAPTALPRGSTDGKVVIHPRTVLTAFVAAAVVLTELVRGTNPAQADQHEAAIATPNPESLFSQAISRLLARESSANLAGAGAAVGLGAWSVASIATGFAARGDDLAEAPDEVSVQAAARIVGIADAFMMSESAGISPSDGQRMDFQTVSSSSGSSLRPAARSETTIDLDADVVVEAGAAGGRMGPDFHAQHALEIGDAVLGPRDLMHSVSITWRPPSGSAEAVVAGDVTSASRERGDVVGAAAEIFDIRFTVAEKTLISKALVFAEEPGASELVAFTRHADSRDNVLVGGDWELIDDEIGGLKDPDPVTKADNAPHTTERASVPTKDYVAHFAVDGYGHFIFTDGRSDVFVVGKGSSVIENFRFGEDIIFVDGFGPSDQSWFKSVTSFGDDIQIIGVDGSRIWLVDAFVGAP